MFASRKVYNRIFMCSWNRPKRPHIFSDPPYSQIQNARPGTLSKTNESLGNNVTFPMINIIL